MLDRDDLKIDVWQSQDTSGARDAVIQITHLPTGIAVARRATSSIEDAEKDALRELEARLNAESV